MLIAENSIAVRTESRAKYIDSTLVDWRQQIVAAADNFDSHFRKKYSVSCSVNNSKRRLQLTVISFKLEKGFYIKRYPYDTAAMFCNPKINRVIISKLCKVAYSCYIKREAKSSKLLHFLNSGKPVYLATEG